MDFINNLITTPNHRSRSRQKESSHRLKSIIHHRPSHSNEEYSSHHNAKYYQNPPRYQKHKSHYHSREPKIDLPSFYGTVDVDDYLSWEMKVE